MDTTIGFAVSGRISFKTIPMIIKENEKVIRQHQLQFISSPAIMTRPILTASPKLLPNQKSFPPCRKMTLWNIIGHYDHFHRQDSGQ